MIRQAISCDICGTEKKQTNHWFVAWEQAGELRVSGWHSRNRLRAGSMHLCGQACLHKLADEFMARVIAGRTGGNLAVDGQDDAAAQTTALADTSLTSPPAHEEFESSARLLPAAAEPRVEPPASSATVLSQPLPRPVQAPIAISERPRPQPLPAIPDEPPRFASRNWRAEAWERERERTQRAGEHRPAIVPRRISQA